MTERWTDYIDTIANGLRGLVVTDRDGHELSATDGITRWVEITRVARDHDQHLYLIGNGGSAAMASHMAADACKNGRMRALALNDAALLTATSNDLAFDEAFSLPLERLARPGDVLVTISTSGNSPNIVRALQTGRAIGLNTVTLSGRSADNQSRMLGDLNFYVALNRYGWAESAHQIILHYWFDQFLHVHGQGAV